MLLSAEIGRIHEYAQFPMTGNTCWNINGVQTWSHCETHLAPIVVN